MDFSGLYIGTVVDNNDSKDKENGYLGRIKVSIPSVYGNIKTDDLPWCEPCFPYASNDRGFFFIPELGAKVTVMFINNSPYKPVWLGCIYREVDKVRLPISAVNNYPDRKIIQTGTGHLMFDDKDEYIELKHKNGSTYYIDDKGNVGFQTNKNSYIAINNNDGTLKIKHNNNSCIDVTNESIVVAHKSGSSIKMNEDGTVEIYSPNDMSIKSMTNIKIQANGVLDLKGGAGVNITSKAKINLNNPDEQGKYKDIEIETPPKKVIEK